MAEAVRTSFENARAFAGRDQQAPTDATPWSPGSAVPVHALLSRLESTDWHTAPRRDHLLPGATRAAIMIGSSAILWATIALAGVALF